MPNIYNFTYENLEEKLISLGEKKFRTRQIWQWLYEKRVKSFDEMRNLSSELISKLKDNFSFDYIEIVTAQRSDSTNKYLFKLKDGNFIEAVLMKHDYGLSVCVSSQVGCNMGCAFCESGRLKKVRNVESFEIIEQILLSSEDINERISSIVIMGIGEPFDNYDNIINFIKIVNNPFGLAIGARHITVSTCGIIPKIQEFMNLLILIKLSNGSPIPITTIESILIFSYVLTLITCPTNSDKVKSLTFLSLPLSQKEHPILHPT